MKSFDVRVTIHEPDYCTVEQAKNVIEGQFRAISHEALSVTETKATTPVMVNLNDRCKVRLCEGGKKILAERREEMMRRFPDQHWELWLREDSDGTVTMMLWDVMKIFGPHMHIGGGSPISAVIEVIQ
jgi:hypothetical protein